MRDLVINTVKKEKLIVIVRGCAPDKLIPLARAMYEGGVRLIEITYSANGSTSDEDTAKSIALLSKEFEGKMLVGAGTVTSVELVDMAAELGVIKKSGSWFSYEGERLAQGKDNARKVFESNQELMDELEAKVRAMADKLVDNNDEFELDDEDEIDAFEIETLSDED